MDYNQIKALIDAKIKSNHRGEITGADVNEVCSSLADFSQGIIPVTWGGLVDLRDAGRLIPGAWYRIIDYQCSAVVDDYAAGYGIEVMCAEHQFDILVLAVDDSTLSEEARAMHHDGDSYFDHCNLNAWKLWYCLDNDTQRFAWANNLEQVNAIQEDYFGYYLQYVGTMEDPTSPGRTLYLWGNNEEWAIDMINDLNGGEGWNAFQSPIYFTTTVRNPAVDSTGAVLVKYNYGDEQTPDWGWSREDSIPIDAVECDGDPIGRGVIYRMIDENNNDCPYDFKNIMFLIEGSSYDSFYCYTFTNLPTSYEKNGNNETIYFETPQEQDDLTDLSVADFGIWASYDRVRFKKIHDNYIRPIFREDGRQYLTYTIFVGAFLSNTSNVPLHCGSGSSGDNLLFVCSSVYDNRIECDFVLSNIFGIGTDDCPYDSNVFHTYNVTNLRFHNRALEFNQFYWCHDIVSEGFESDFSSNDLFFCRNTYIERGQSQNSIQNVESCFLSRLASCFLNDIHAVSLEFIDNSTLKRLYNSTIEKSQRITINPANNAQYVKIGKDCDLITMKDAQCVTIGEKVTDCSFFGSLFYVTIGDACSKIVGETNQTLWNWFIGSQCRNLKLNLQAHEGVKTIGDGCRYLSFSGNARQNSSGFPGNYPIIVSPGTGIQGSTTYQSVSLLGSEGGWNTLQVPIYVYLDALSLKIVCTRVSPLKGINSLALECTSTQIINLAETYNADFDVDENPSLESAYELVRSIDTFNFDTGLGLTSDGKWCQIFLDSNDVITVCWLSLVKPGSSVIYKSIFDWGGDSAWNVINPASDDPDEQ